MPRPHDRPCRRRRAGRRRRRLGGGAGRAAAALLGALLAALVPLAAAGQGGTIDFALGTRPLGGLRPDRVALLLSGRDGGVVETAAVALPLPREGVGRVLLFVEIDGASLLGAEPPAAPRLEVYAYALTAAGAVAGHLAQGIDLDLERVGEAIYSGGLKFAGGLDLPPGRYVLHLLVFETAGRRYGLRTLPIELAPAGGPAAEGASPPGAAGQPGPPGPPAPPAESEPPGRILTPPIFPEPLGSWLLAGEAPRPGQPATGVGALLAGGGPLPAARPLLPAAGTAVADLLVAGPPAGALTVEIALAGPAGGERTVAAQVVERAAADLPGIERLRLAIPLAGVEPGRYRLRAEVAAAGGDRLVSAPIEVSVVAGPGGPPGRIWAGLDRPERTAAAAAPTLDVAPSGRRRRRDEPDGKAVAAVAAAYRDALARLAAGADAEAREAMKVFEGGAVRQLGADPGGVLPAGELHLLERLAGRDPEALLPALALHLDLYPRYLEVKDYFLAVHSRTMVEQIAELYARSAATPSARTLASRALTRLGFALERAQLMAKARGLLRRAAELDPSDPAALLALATGDEKLGEYAQAVVPLRRLVELDPKSAEGRLRLAINLDRTGDAAGAAALYRRLTAEANPDWVLSLAYQQLARGHLDAGRPAAAARLLAEAADRLPGDERLRLALAYALDRAGDPAGARAAVGRLTLRGPGGRGSSRWRYNEWPEEGAAGEGDLLERNARARRASLAAALDGLGAGGRR
jgi:tetratricopeptide (TPR) repeat protein